MSSTTTSPRLDVSPSTNDVEAFVAAISAAGLTPPAQIIEDGKIHRYPTNGKPGDKSGWYVLHGDGLAAGAYGCWRSGVNETWHASDLNRLTLDERQTHQERLKQLQQQREEEAAHGHEEAAARATEIWGSASPADAAHPYLVQKGVQVNGLRLYRGDLCIAGLNMDGAVVVPIRDEHGKLWSLAFILPDGEKRFLPGGRKRGCFHVIGQLTESTTDAYIGEGVATGASVHQATDRPVVIAFDAGNLKPVAGVIREKYPHVHLIICGDHDPSGTGQSKAREAAQTVSGGVVIPEIEGDDWNDVHRRDGLEPFRTAILAKLTPPTQYLHLLDGNDPAPPLRLPQDFRDGILGYGIILGGKPYIVKGDQSIVSAEESGATDYGLSNVRFSKSGIKRFLQGDAVPGATLFGQLTAFLRRFIVMGDDLLDLLALWIVGTYLYAIFEYFPYLVLRSPEKRCGKTRTLDSISLLAFNAHQPTASPTEAQIFREPREDGGVQIFDEMEGMTSDKERWSSVTSVFNAGFHKGQVVARYRKTSQGQQKETFETYVPRAIASISALETTLEDRSIMFMMQRLLPGQQTERFSLRRLDAEARTLRDDLHIFALSMAPMIAELYDGSEFPGLSNLDHRAVDLWEPLLSVAAVIDASGGTGTLTKRMTQLAERLGGERASRSADDPNPIIIEVLDEYVGLGALAKVRAEDLAEKVRTRLGWDSLTLKALANRLHPLGLKSSRWREGQTNQRGYQFSRTQIDDLARRYTAGNPEQPEHGTVK